MIIGETRHKYKIWILLKMSEILKSPHRNKKKSGAFLVGVPLFLFLLEIFLTLLTLYCLFHVNIHIDKVVNVMFVEKF